MLAENEVDEAATFEMLAAHEEMQLTGAHDKAVAAAAAALENAHLEESTTAQSVAPADVQKGPILQIDQSKCR